jgi:uncharacterized protein YdhG (YjbR/CyaY superfamily)
MDSRVKEYFSVAPDSRLSKLNALHKIIVSSFPDIHLDMKYKMPTYQLGDGWVAIANQKNYVSLYTCGYHHIEKFKQKNPEIKTGKGCINFRDKDKIPLQDVRQVIQHAIKHPK